MKDLRRATGSAMLLLLPVLCALGWIGLAGYEGLNGQDAHDYLRLAKEWSAWAAGGVRPIMVEHPHGYPIAGAALGALIGDELVGLRVLSACASVLIAVALRLVLRRAYPGAHMLDGFILLAAVLSPFLLRYSLVVMSDMPAIALLCWAFVCTVRWITDERPRRLLGAVFFAVAALTMRLAAAPMVGLMAVLWVHGGPSGRRIRWSVAAVLVALAVVVLLIIGVGPEDMVARLPLEDWSLSNLIRRELVSDDGILRFRFPNILYVLSIVVHPGFIPMGLLLLPFVRRSDLRPVHARAAMLLAAGYLVFIAGMPYQNDRVLSMAQPFVVLLYFPAFQRAVEAVRAKGVPVAAFISVMAVVQAALFVRAILPFMHQARVERDLADLLNAAHPQRVYTHGMGAAFGTLGRGVEVSELWYGVQDHFEPGAWVVVRPADLATQWAGTPPAINWERVQAQGVTDPVQGPDGWVLCRVR